MCSSVLPFVGVSKLISAVYGAQWRAASVTCLPLCLVLPSLDLVLIEVHIVAPAYILLGPQPLKPVCNAHTFAVLCFPGKMLWGIYCCAQLC